MKTYKDGNITANLFNEVHVEPDGSLWVQCFYHVNPTGQKFTSSDTFSTGVYHDGTMWLNFNICKALTSWEFLAMQASTETASVVKYRWIQTKSPFNAAYADVAPSAVTRVTTTGYTDAGSSNGGGIYVADSNNTYMITANSNSGNWYGAVGCKVAYNGGIPGFNGTTCTTGFMSVYVRVTSAQIKLFKTPDILSSEEIIEY